MNGLVHIDNVVSFDSAVDQLRQPTGLLSTCPIEFHNYCNRRLLQLMRDNCAAGRSTWTNNNCESINHVLKQAVQWRRKQLPELIDKFRTLVDGQHADADRALCGRSDFCLRPPWSKHRLTMECWTAMKPTQRQKAAEACFRLPVASTSTSSDGALTIPTTPGGGKKPHQKKRCRTERTTSVKQRRLHLAKPTDIELDSDADFE